MHSMQAAHRRRFLRQSLALGGLGLAGGGLTWAAATQAEEAGAGGLVMELVLFRQGTLPPPPVDERNETWPAPTLVHDQLTPVPAAKLQLAGAAATLRKRADYGLIASGGWFMPVPSNGGGVVAIGDVATALPGAGQIAGSLGLQRGTYLTLSIDVLWAPKDNLQLVLSEKRRVKFNEHHYFDHESFGAIVLVRAPV